MNELEYILPCMLLDISNTVEKLKDLSIGKETSVELMKRLEINTKGDRWAPTVKVACRGWLTVYGERCTLETLVRALVLTKGLGHLVSGMQPIGIIKYIPDTYSLQSMLCPYSVLPDVVKFFKSIKDPDINWKAVAVYLGFDTRVITAIESKFRTPKKQLQCFCRVWRLPECSNADEVLEVLGNLCGLTSGT